MKAILRYKGGSGSGNFDHTGRPGEVGGSSSSSNIASVKQAIEIIQMQSMGAPPKHIEVMLRENDIDYIQAYHITSIEGAKIIEKDGIKLSYQENRPDASYFFLDKKDIGRNAHDLGHHGEYAIITIRIPRNDAANIKDDGFFNATFSSSYSAARLFRSIPAEWIVME